MAAASSTQSLKVGLRLHGRNTVQEPIVLTMMLIKCVVTGDGAVGKVRNIAETASRTTFADFYRRHVFLYHILQMPSQENIYPLCKAHVCDSTGSVH